MKISIITVCYNVAEELRLTMNSVLKQGYSNIEYIVIDGGSSDRSRDVIKSFVEPISELGGELKWLSESDNGIYDAMNKGLDRATGDWVLFMNAGDSFASESVLNDVFSIPRSSDVIFGKSITRYKELSSIRFLDFETQNKDWYLSKMPNQQAIFINKSLYENRRYDLSFRYFSDTVFMRSIFESEALVDECDFSICNFELGGKSNFYGGWDSFEAIVSDSIRINKTILSPLLKHSFKYFLQLLLGRNLYLKIYIKALKE